MKSKSKLTWYFIYETKYTIKLALLEISKICAKIADCQTMRPEQTRRIPYDPRKELKRQMVATGMRLIAPIIEMGTDNILQTIKTEFEPGAKNNLKAEAKKGKLFLLVPNHQCLIDPLTLLPTTDEMLKITGMPGLFLPYTMTVETGDKGMDIKGLQDILSGRLLEHKIKRILLARASDGKNFGIRENVKDVEDEIRGYLQQGMGGLIYAEGCLDAPRPKGVYGQMQKTPLEIIGGIFRSEKSRLAIERNGMQHFQRASLKSIIKLADELGIGIDIVEIVTSGTKNIYDEATRTITRSALRVGLGLSDYSLGKIIVRNPIDIDGNNRLGEIRRRNPGRMKPQDWIDFNDEICRDIASRLPRRMQGVFGNIVA